MAQGVSGGLVDPGVQGGHVYIQDLLPWASLMVKCHGASASTKKSISRLKRRCRGERRKKRGNRRGRLDLALPLALPLHHHLITGMTQSFQFSLSGFIQFSQGPVRVGPILPPALVFVTGRATVPQTPHELEHNGWLHDQSVHKFFPWSRSHFLLTAISNVLDGLRIQSLLVCELL